MIHFGLWIGLLFASAWGAPQEARVAQVQWRAIGGADAYEIEVGANDNIDPVLLKQVTTQVMIEVKLQPGTYYFRVRGIDSSKRPGPWSEVQGFQVNQAPPKTVFPPNLSSFSQRLPPTGMLFTWVQTAQVEKSPEVAIEVRDASGKVLERTTHANRLSWMPTKAGLYEWRVGNVTPVGVDWSPVSTFFVKQTALPGSVLAAALLTLDELGYPETDENGYTRQWSATARLGQSLLLWDAGTTAPLPTILDSGSNFVGGGSLELAHRFPRTRTQKKLLTVLAQASVLREIVDTQSVWVPRGHLQAHVTWGAQAFRWGPILRVGLGSGQLVVPDTTGSARLAELFFRYSVGLGLMGVMVASPRLNITLNAIARLDVGGRSDRNNIVLLPTVGYEGSVGIKWFFSDKFWLDFRLRGLGEFYKWSAGLSGASPDPNYFGNTFVFADLGLGVAF
jgi:hypothetical protein